MNSGSNTSSLPAGSEIVVLPSGGCQEAPSGPRGPSVCPSPRPGNGPPGWRATMTARTLLVCAFAHETPPSASLAAAPRPPGARPAGLHPALGGHGPGGRAGEVAGMEDPAPDPPDPGGDAVGDARLVARLSAPGLPAEVPAPPGRADDDRRGDAGVAVGVRHLRVAAALPPEAPLRRAHRGRDHRRLRPEVPGRALPRPVPRPLGVPVLAAPAEGLPGRHRAGRAPAAPPRRRRGARGGGRRLGGAGGPRPDRGQGAASAEPPGGPLDRQLAGAQRAALPGGRPSPGHVLHREAGRPGAAGGLLHALLVRPLSWRRFCSCT